MERRWTVRPGHASGSKLLHKVLNATETRLDQFPCENRLNRRVSYLVGHSDGPGGCWLGSPSVIPSAVVTPLADVPQHIGAEY